ncbi:MAG TPA: ricin-type beta-trefoil lectin domain protein [Actinocrinis sp.]|nr:ricin-type beta-trefoil lectin domain protein [Actinocrinis sp.]
MKKKAAVPVLAVAVAVGAAWAASPALATPPQPTTGTQSSVHAQSAAVSPVQTAALRLEPVGDSITYGYQSTTGNGYREELFNDLTGEGHPLDLVGSAQGGTMADPDNEGHSGWRIDQIAGIIDNSLAAYKPNVITLMIGTNDMGQDYQVSTAPARLNSLITQIENDDPTATLLVANLIVSTNTEVAQYEPAFNAAIPGIVQAQANAGHHIALVDMHSALTTADLFDALHPNDEGYAKMGDVWNTAVQAAAAQGWISAPSSLGAPTARPSAEVASGIAGKCLDLNGGNSADGTPVQLWDCNHTAAQTWTPYTDSTLRVMGKCLDAAAGGTADGTKTQIYDCNGSGAQLWQPYDGGYLNLASGRCLDDPGGSTTNGTQLELWDCNGAANQKWAPPTPTPVTSGIAGKCLDDTGGGTADGTTIELWSCNGGGNQQWLHTGGTLQYGGKCLDIVGGSTANGALLDLWDCNNGGNQQWTAVGDTLVNPASGKCLDDPAASTTDGTRLEIWDCNGGANQVWTLSA